MVEGKMGMMFEKIELYLWNILLIMWLKVMNVL